MESVKRYCMTLITQPLENFILHLVNIVGSQGITLLHSTFDDAAYDL